MRKGKFKFTNKEGIEEQVALETLLDQIVDSPIRALMPNTEYKKGEIVFFKPLPTFFAVCVGAGQTDGNIRALIDSDCDERVPCGTAMFLVHSTPLILTRKDLTAYAKRESPHLTGTPTAPTASSDTNTTQIATTEFVKTALAMFNLDEYLKVADAQRTYAPLNSPRLTGTPVAPTPNDISEDTSIATTEWVKRVINISGGGIVAANLKQNGYVKFANGLILQWGTSSETLRDKTVTYPLPFGRLYSVVGVPKSNSVLSGSNSNFGIKAQTNTNFIANMYDNGNGYGGFNWCAVGR